MRGRSSGSAAAGATIVDGTNPPGGPWGRGAGAAVAFLPAPSIRRSLACAGGLAATSLDSRRRRRSAWRSSRTGRALRPWALRSGRGGVVAFAGRRRVGGCAHGNLKAWVGSVGPAAPRGRDEPQARGPRRRIGLHFGTQFYIGRAGKARRLGGSGPSGGGPADRRPRAERGAMALHVHVLMATWNGAAHLEEQLAVLRGADAPGLVALGLGRWIDRRDRADAGRPCGGPSRAGAPLRGAEAGERGQLPEPARPARPAPGGRGAGRPGRRLAAAQAGTGAGMARTGGWASARSMRAGRSG